MIRPSPPRAVIVYSMTMSLDGYIAGPDGEIDWSAPDEELHRFHNEQVRELDGHFLGRRLYETMRYWDGEDPSRGAVGREFAGIWRALPKVVFSRTLERVEGNARLAAGDAAQEAAAQDPGAVLAVGGAGLAASFIRLGLVDEFRIFVAPVVLGGGTPLFPALGERVPLELVEQRRFATQALYLRYRTVPVSRRP